MAHPSVRSIRRFAARSRIRDTCRPSRTNSRRPKISRRCWNSTARWSTSAALDDALDDVALSRQRTLPARVLSQGQRRRIGLARLTMLPRPLWILDEPTTALDGAGASLLTRILARHLANRGVVVAATHAPLGLDADRVRPLELT